MGDQVVDVDLAFHVPINDLRHVGTAPGAAEGGAAPYPASDQLERPRGDFLAGAGDADDGALAPSLVAALQGLAHGGDVADAFEGMIGAAFGQVDQVRHQVAFDLVRIDEMGHAEFFGDVLASGINVDTDDHLGADHPGALDDVEADAA